MVTIVKPKTLQNIWDDLTYLTRKKKRGQEGVVRVLGKILPIIFHNLYQPITGSPFANPTNTESILQDLNYC